MRLPSLTFSAHLALEELIFLFSLRRSRKQAEYLTCSRAYLAKKIGRCETTISRATTELEDAGLIQKECRRPRYGKYATAIYFPTAKLWRHIKKISMLYRVTSRSLKPFKVNKSSRKMRSDLLLYFKKSSFWSRMLQKQEVIRV